MKPINLNSVLFNVAGLGLVVFLAGYMIQSALTTETVPGCSKRYGDGQQFSLTTSEGAPMTPIELQARLPSRAWGLLTNARVVAAADKSPFLQVALGLSDEQKQREAEDPMRRRAGCRMASAFCGVCKAWKRPVQPASPIASSCPRISHSKAGVRCRAFTA